MTTINKMTTFYNKKDDMFKEVGYDKPFYFSKDISTDGAFKEFFCCDDINDVKEILEVDNNIYEIICENKSRYSYVDLDGTYQSFKKYITDDMYVDDFIIREFKIMLEEYKEKFGFDEDVDNLIILQGTKPNKISFHILDKSIVLKNCYECNLYHKKFIEYLQEKDSCLLDLLDKGVYDKDRNFRCINQSKKTTIPYPLKCKDEIINTLVCCNETSIDIPQSWKISKDKIIKCPEKVIVDNSEVELLLKHINDDRWTEYKKWIETVWCLIALKIDIDIIHDLSYEICPDKYDKNTLDCIIKQYDPSKNWTINTLRKWAEEDSDFVVEREFNRIQPVLSENREEHMTWLDLQSKYYDKVFIDDVGFEEFIVDVCKVVLYCQMGGKAIFSVYTNDSLQFDLCNSLTSLTFAIGSSKSPEKVKVWELQKYIEYHPLKFTRFNKIVFKPLNHNIKKWELNIWSGFKAQKIKDIDMSIVNVFINHIREIWANNNEEVFRYIMSWLAHIIQQPYKKTGIAIVLQSCQGTGKTLPCDILLERVFGFELGLSTTGLTNITKNFNSILKGKIFTKVDELNNITQGDFHGAFDKMKDNITGNWFELEKKGIDSIQIENLNNFLLTTNNTFSVKIEDGDRRYACFEASDKYKGNFKYFDNFTDVCDNDIAGDNIFSYFLQYDDKVDLRNIPMTKLKSDMMEKSKISSISFIEIIDEIDNIYDCVGDNGQKASSHSNLYTCYKTWCIEVGEKCYSQKIFLSHIKSLIKVNGNNRRNEENKMKRYIQF